MKFSIINKYVKEFYNYNLNKILTKVRKYLRIKKKCINCKDIQT
jgi:hypothetical protein